MLLQRALRKFLRPVIAPVRAAVDRRLTALVDARLPAPATVAPELADQRMRELIDTAVRQQLTERHASQLSLVDERSHPTINDLWLLLRDLDNARLTIKFFGYELARALAVALPPPTGLLPGHVGLRSKPSTQADLESDWARYWIGEIKAAHIFHRKLWEFAYVLQAIHENGLLRPGARGLGFGCGTEPLPSYFADHGVHVTVTDLAPEEAEGRGWINTNQHTSSLDAAFQQHLVSREQFDKYVSLRYVDMNAIPADLLGYDFCWSICALEHIGSIQKGLDFIEHSLRTLRPGGIAVHTTEFNFLNDKQTIDYWPTVLFQKRHFRALAERLERQGHHVAPLDFDVGDKPLDKFIDLPPYTHDWTEYQHEIWNGPAPQIKLSIDGFACTCFGIIIRKSQVLPGDARPSP